MAKNMSTVTHKKYTSLPEKKDLKLVSLLVLIRDLELEPQTEKSPIAWAAAFMSFYCFSFPLPEEKRIFPFCVKAEINHIVLCLSTECKNQSWCALTIFFLIISFSQIHFGDFKILPRLIPALKTLFAEEIEEMEERRGKRGAETAERKRLRREQRAEVDWSGGGGGRRGAKRDQEASATTWCRSKETENMSSEKKTEAERILSYFI